MTPSRGTPRRLILTASMLTKAVFARRAGLGGVDLAGGGAGEGLASEFEGVLGSEGWRGARLKLMTCLLLAPFSRRNSSSAMKWGGDAGGFEEADAEVGGVVDEEILEHGVGAGVDAAAEEAAVFLVGGEAVAVDGVGLGEGSRGRRYRRRWWRD